MRLTGGLKKLRTDVENSAPEFVFLDPARVLVSPRFGVGPFRTSVTAQLLAFPSGETLSKRKIPPGAVSRAGDSRFVLVSPWASCSGPPKLGMAAIGIETGEVVTTQGHALDVSGDYYVAEYSKGELGLYKKGNLGTAPAATATLGLW